MEDFNRLPFTTVSVNDSSCIFQKRRLKSGSICLSARVITVLNVLISGLKLTAPEERQTVDRESFEISVGSVITKKSSKMVSISLLTFSHFLSDLKII